MRKLKWRSASMVMVGVLSFQAGHEAKAAAFQLRENTTLGAARAGSGATGGDLSTMFNNPATMATLESSTVSALATVVAPSFHFKNAGATHTYAGGVATTSLTDRGNGGNGGGVTVIPAGYLMWHVNDAVNLGLGITVPFGLTTKYDPNWIGRYFAVKSKLVTTDINPAFSYKVNKHFAFGGGVSVQLAKAELTRGAWTYSGGNPNPSADAMSSLEGSSVGYGFNVGVLLSPWEHTRFGLSYRSSLQHVVKGNASLLRGDNVATNFVRPARAKIALPEIVTLSAHHDLNERWAVMADAEWTRWSRFKSLDVYNEGSAVSVVGVTVPTGGLMSREAFNYENSWFYSLGMRWKCREDLLFKAGLAYDQTPTRPQYRSVRVPDEDRIWVTVGMEHDLTECAKLTLDYAYIHFKNAGIQQTRTTLVGGALESKETLNGRFESNSHLLGVKFQYKF